MNQNEQKPKEKHRVPIKDKIINAEKNQNSTTQTVLSEKLNDCATAIGGKNIFLQILEAMQNAGSSPLMNQNCEFRFARGTIKWSKPIFREKIELLNKIRANNTDGNLFPRQEIKGYKTIINLLRTLKPIVFHVLPKNKKDGKGFSFQPFDIIDDKTTRLNPIFEALFFMSVTQVKKILNTKTKY